MAYVYRLGRMDECAVVVAVCGIAETSKLGKSNQTVELIKLWVCLSAGRYELPAGRWAKTMVRWQKTASCLTRTTWEESPRPVVITGARLDDPSKFKLVSSHRLWRRRQHRITVEGIYRSTGSWSISWMVAQPHEYYIKHSD